MFAGEDGPYQAARGATPWAAGRQVWGPRSQDADSSPQAQGVLGLGFEAKPKGSAERRGPQQPTALVDAWRLIRRGPPRFPHAALKSASLGGHGILHGYSPIAGNAFPNFFASSYLRFLFQSYSSIVLSIAMAPNRTEKGKKPLSSASPPPAVEPAVGQSRVLNQEAMDKVRPTLATSFN